MKKYIFFCLLSVAFMEAPLGVTAQVVLNLQLPPVGLTVKSQLWNLSVVNTTNQPIQAMVELSMTDVSNNQQVLSATTRLLDFPKGLRQIHASEVAPVTYNIQSPGYNVGGSAEGFLPVGNFELCYSIIRIDEAGSERIAGDCETVVIEPLSPPQLVYPADSESLDLSRPLFTWLPPSPFHLFIGLTYDFKLAEVQSLQTGAEAVQQNVPLESQHQLTVPNLQYPISQAGLDTGKLYAWQVTARSAGSEVARSEVWTFRVKKDHPDSSKNLSFNTYAKVKRENEGGYTLCSGVLKYQYLNEWNDRTLDLAIYDISSKDRRPLPLDSGYVAVSYGQNFNTLDFSENSLLKDKHFYQLELVNSKKEHWYLKFQFRKP